MNHEPILFRGGPIRTMNGAIRPEAVLVADGRISAVGEERDCLQAARRSPRIVELDGRCLMPGFVDAHMHMLLHGSRLDWVDLSGARSIETLVTLLADYGAAHPDAEAIRGYGYDQTLLAEQRHPAAADLDRVARARQVQIQHISGHGYVVNSKVLADHGITRDTPTPLGGRLDHDATGDPTGLVFDAACDLLTGPSGVKVRNHGPNFHLPISVEEHRRLLHLSQESFLQAGVTSVCDAQVTDLEMTGYVAARDAGELLLKAQVLMLSSHMDHLRAAGIVGALGDDHLGIAGVKFYADGSVLARTACLGDCCGGHRGDHRDGYLYHEPEELGDLLASAHELGFSTATHAQGTYPIELVLEAVGRARARRPRPDVLHRIEHCGFPTDEQVARMRTLGIVPVPQPLQVHERADALIAEYGPAGGRFYPYGAFAEAEIGVIVSSDAPVTDPAPLHSAWAAITRETSSGQVAGGTELAVTREQALAGITRTPARLLRRSGDGRIEEGTAADLVLLDGDPFEGAIEALPSIAATETWVDGRPVWRRGEGVLAATEDRVPAGAAA
ncbi:MAG TPA: amidohydrolase [Solirubrobacteraceae bacterium]|nr:amidohydrolase [Solirubrobacteraceae bacterium]